MTDAEIVRGADELTVTMPVAPNRLVVGLGFGVAAPWLLVFAVASVVVPIIVPQDVRRYVILGVVVVNLLLVIAHVLAVMGVWLAAYKLRGTEQVMVTPDRFVVRRRALGITVPIRLGRTTYDVVELLDLTTRPGRGAYPRLEVRAGHSAVRFGAGLSAREAERVHDVLAEEFDARRWR